MPNLKTLLLDKRLNLSELGARVYPQHARPTAAAMLIKSLKAPSPLSPTVAQVVRPFVTLIRKSLDSPEQLLRLANDKRLRKAAVAVSIWPEGTAGSAAAALLNRQRNKTITGTERQRLRTFFQTLADELNAALKVPQKGE